MHPLCVHCLDKDRIGLAIELDHIVPLELGGLDFDVDEGKNRQGLCSDCHAIKTAKDRGFAPIGGDVNGIPTDPRHPWNQNP